MFQYSAGKALSLLHDSPLRLDISGFAAYGLHQGFELQRVFDCQVDYATEAEIHSILGWQAPPLIQRVAAKSYLAAIRRKAFIIEPHFHYWPGLKNISYDCYLRGYWQSEKYFLEAAADIRKDFTFKTTFEEQNAKLATQIDQVNAVSLHVRRGDYVNDPKTKATLGLCSLEYYHAAIRHIADRVTEPHFFIFSDDISWVKEHLTMGFPCIYVDHNHSEKSYNDMHLMSLCNHHIIANSSFSWWGAWLNPRQDKNVVAPLRWFANSNCTKDLFPPGWVTL